MNTLNSYITDKSLIFVNLYYYILKLLVTYKNIYKKKRFNYNLEFFLFKLKKNKDIYF